MSGHFTFVTCAFVAITILAASGCRKQRRPASVPAAAIELGGMKRIYYVECDSISGATYDCTVFGAGGNTMAKSYFTLIGGETFRAHDVSEYDSFDGEQIRLTNDRALVASAPPRPNGVPPSASWSGGPTCGAYFDCSALDAGSEFRCRVYDDRSGKLAADRHYRVQGPWDRGLGELYACSVEDVANGQAIDIGRGLQTYLAPVNK